MANSDPSADEVAEAEPDEPEKSLLTLAELFVGGPAKQNGSGPRSADPQPASLSLFEWALAVEGEREKDIVGT